MQKRLESVNQSQPFILSTSNNKLLTEYSINKNILNHIFKVESACVGKQLFKTVTMSRKRE